MVRIIGIFAFLLFVSGCSTTNLTLNTATPAVPFVTHLPKKVEPMQPNGNFQVLVLHNGSWLPSGSLGFDKHIRQQELKLPVIIEEKGEIRVRLQQQGGGAAHLDMVSLNGAGPGTVAGADGPDALRKLAKRDDDLIHAHDRTIDLAFPGPSKDAVLLIAGRIENPVIGTTPFQFPSHNMYRQMSRHSAFLPYRLNSVPGSLTLADSPDPLPAASPFFKEYSRTGSGHPSGFTWGWVKNDNDNLYVTIDFTPDNTRDGNTDYTKVYARTAGGLKEFKISEKELRWGRPYFTYTDKVPYQHKVYEFKIPLTELEITDPKQEKPVQLAFAAYGTAAPGDINNAVAYNPNANQYLLVFDSDRTFAGTDIRGQILDGNGALVGNDFIISNVPQAESRPRVAFDAINNVYLVVWEDDRNTPSAPFVYGQIVRSDGLLVGTNFRISTNGTSAPVARLAVDYDSNAQRFLVAWEDGRSDSIIEIYGQLVNPDGTLFPNDDPDNDNFFIGSAGGNSFTPAIAYDSIDSRFLVTWEDQTNIATNGSDILGQFVDGAAADLASTLVTRANTVGTDIFPISNQAVAPMNQTMPSVAFDQASGGRFLTIFRDNRNGVFQNIFAQIIDGLNGNPIGSTTDTNVELTNNWDQTTPAAACNGTGSCLAVWEHNPNTERDIYGRYMAADGTPTGPEFSIVATPALDEHLPAISRNTFCNNYLVTNATGSFAGIFITRTVVEPPCPESTALLESFETDPTIVRGWTVVDNTGNGGWAFDDLGAIGNTTTTGSGNFAIIDSSFIGFSAVDTELRSPAMDFRSRPEVYLRFDTRYLPGSSTEFAEVDVSVNGGAWTNVWQMQGINAIEAVGPVQLDLTSLAAGQQNVVVRFHYWGAIASFYWEVDEVEFLSLGRSLSVNLSAGGTVSAPGRFSCSGTVCGGLYAGGSVDVTATPDAGNEISWSGCDSAVGNTCTVSMAANKSVSATFAAIPTFTVTPSAGTGGTISPTTAQTVTSGGNTSFTITADTANGYSIDTVSGCGGTWNGTNPYVTGAVTADCTVSATFIQASFTVTPSAGTGGTISPATAATVAFGGTTSFTITADTANGYSINTVSGCGGTWNGTNPYVTGAVTADCTVTATFSQTSFTVTPTAGTGGTINAAVPQTVAVGGTTSFTVTADTANGYHVASVSGCGGTWTGTNPYVTGAVTANCTVTASFALDTFAAALQANGGTIGGPTTVTYGTMPTYTIAADGDHKLTDVTVNSVSVGAVSSYTFTTPISGPITVAATFGPMADGDMTQSDGLPAGQVSIADALKALRIAVGLQVATPQDLLHGDVAPLVGGVPAPDGRIDHRDALVLLRKVVGLVNW